MDSTTHRISLYNKSLKIIQDKKKNVNAIKKRLWGVLVSSSHFFAVKTNPLMKTKWLILFLSEGHRMSTLEGKLYCRKMASLDSADMQDKESLAAEIGEWKCGYGDSWGAHTHFPLGIPAATAQLGLSSCNRAYFSVGLFYQFYNFANCSITNTTPMT